MGVPILSETRDIGPRPPDEGKRWPPDTQPEGVDRKGAAFGPPKAQAWIWGPIPSPRGGCPERGAAFRPSLSPNPSCV